MHHTAHIIGAIILYALIFSAFFGALYWRVRVRLGAAAHDLSEHPSDNLIDEKPSK